VSGRDGLNASKATRRTAWIALVNAAAAPDRDLV